VQILTQTMDGTSAKCDDSALFVFDALRSVRDYEYFGRRQGFDGIDGARCFAISAVTKTALYRKPGSIS
jgi:hypothetical protein